MSMVKILAGMKNIYCFPLNHGKRKVSRKGNNNG